VPLVTGTRRARSAGLILIAALALAPASALGSRIARPSPGAIGSQHGTRSSTAGAFGLIPIRGSSQGKTTLTVPVVYHGGQVMHSVTVHTVFWSPPGFPFSGAPSKSTLGYEALIQQFFTDVAHDSGTTSNAFSVLPSYSDTSGPGSYSIAYDAKADTVRDSNAIPLGCPSPAGLTQCVTDADLRKELDKVITNPADRGLNNIWFVFLPPGVDECVMPQSCASNAFAGYHADYNGPQGITVYAPIPEISVEVTPPPGSDPEGNPNAEAGIDTVAHETVEAITDPTGVGWMDPNGFEAGDKCENGPQYGAPLGYAANGSPYNQLINGHEYLLQMMWSGAANGCVQRSTAAPPGTVPEVSLTQFSPYLSGHTGIAKAGVKVDLILVRAGNPVGEGSTRTRADGSWGPAKLLGTDGAPIGVGDDRDAIGVAYVGGGPPNETILTGNGGNPFTQSGFTGWFDLDNGFAVVGTGARSSLVAVGPCSQTGLIGLTVGKAAQVSPTTSCQPDSDTSITNTKRITAGTSITLTSEDNRAVFADNGAGALIKMTVPVGEPDSVSAFGNTLLPFAPTGFPTCTADLQSAHVGCSGLVPFNVYSLIRRRGHTTVKARAGIDGVAHFSRLSGLRGGDLLTLRNGERRTLTVLHVAHLRASIAGNETVLSSGECQPGLYWGPPLSAPPVGTGVVVTGVVGDGIACPFDGDASGMPANQIEQIDDLSGGITLTHVPLLADSSPSADETVPSVFTALAGAAVPGPNGAIVRTRAEIALAITPSGSKQQVFHAANVDTTTGVVVGPLAVGVYNAKWIVRDRNGDARTITSRFIVG
jgi:hypothetical protein